MYEQELRFLRRTLEKCRLQVLELTGAAGENANMDLGLRHMLGMEAEHERLLQGSLRHLAERTVYRVTDPFRCGYMMMRLPGRGTVLLLGPWLKETMDSQHIMEQAEQLGLAAHTVPLLESYYSALPVVADPSFLMACVNTFAEKLWGGEQSYQVVDVNQQFSHIPTPGESEPPQPDTLAWSIRAAEERYAFENELMQAVSQGLGHKAEQMLAGFSFTAMERRQADPLREVRNYCIIINTLLRKAAERGGAHPFHLDRVSSSYARRIEQIGHADAGKVMIAEMFREYCRLVTHRALSGYSQVVQRVILQIDADLAGDLSLRSLAQRQNINASYLSDLFRRETGRTVTDYVNRRRVEQALLLLAGTRLQIQTVAQHCGIPDVNYFSRVFRRYTGISPREYRTVTVHGTK